MPGRGKAPRLAITAPEFDVHESYHPVAVCGLGQAHHLAGDGFADKHQAAMLFDDAAAFCAPDLVRGVIVDRRDDPPGHTSPQALAAQGAQGRSRAARLTWPSCYLLESIRLREEVQGRGYGKPRYARIRRRRC